jgi:hypothetical protein
MRRSAAERLVQSAQRLLSSLTEVVDFAALESGEVDLETERSRALSSPGQRRAF